MQGLTLDAGALIGLERSSRRVIALLARAEEVGAELIVPAPVIAHVARNPARQVRLMRLLRQPACRSVALDRADATLVGRLLAATGTSDIADGHVAICATRSGYVVVTSDPDDLRRLAPEIALIEV